YGVRIGDDTASAYAAVDDMFLPMLTAPATGGGDLDDRGQALSVEGAEVSSVVRRAGEIVVRVFNPTAEPSTVHIDGRSGWLIDLRGRPLEPFEGSFELGPFKIATAQLASSVPL